MMVEVERDWEDRLEKVRENVRDHAEWRINALQQHYQARNKRRRQAEQDEEVSSDPQRGNEEAISKPRV
jgi:hypothetical protein